MFRPTDRINLSEALRPPAGYVVDAALATTYSLDFDGLAAACIALIGDDLDGTGVPPRHAILRAFGRLSSRLLVVTNQGMADFDRTGRNNRLGALLDGCLSATGAEGAAFHPKVWVVRYSR